ncbi:carboxypeptidase regulatory-like domain-containing protein [Ilumatobacter sp.]|uniref:carboxypeptidase regulatory-like domain-containing protein n=1 Tax=Ilumatobacter sp. TaxID=1967498 RepID=UPI003753B06C
MKPIESKGMRTDLRVSHVAVTPGEPLRLPITVTNTATVIDGVTAIIDGLNPNWVSLEQPLISLFPDASGELELIFDIPRSCAAGDYLIVVRVLSTIEPERQTVHDFWLTVGAIIDVNLSLRPEIVSGGKSAKIQATVVNTGNSTTDVIISAIEPTREIDCSIRPSRFSVPQNSETLVDVVMRGSRPWFGQSVTRNIVFTVKAGDAEVIKSATFNQRARIPRGAITAFTLVAIVLLWALMFLLVISKLNSSDTASKAPATAFNVGGEANVPLSNIAGNAAGTVTAATTGAGLPRVTIEALRETVDDEGEFELLTVGSAATAEDGSFTFEALVPGKYRFCFSGDGFEEFCYLEGSTRGTSDRAVGTTLTVRPKKPLESSLDIELNGMTGNFIGTVTLPSGADQDADQTQSAASVPSVTATQVVEGPGREAGEPIAADVDPITGEFDFDLDNDGTGDLPTPATYLITISGDSFATQQFKQKLEAGATPLIPTINLGAANARLSGTVSDINGGPLGNVTVTARSGDFVVRTITPTIGNVGTFVFSGLKTPETYVLTFERDNYASMTITRDMQPGKSVTDINQALSGGYGTVTGVTVSSTGSGVGDLTVRVVAQDQVAVSSTLSDGSFRLDDLPLTGTYVVTVSGDGYRSETVRVAANTAGPVDVGSIVLGPRTSDLNGTISFGSTTLSGATVSVTDGTKQLITTTSSNPTGFYAFSGLAPGSYALTVDAPGLQRRVVALTIEAGVNVNRNVSLSGASVSGVVTFAGAPLAGAKVTLDDDQTTTTDRTGRYSFVSLKSGSYRLIVTDEGLLETAQFTLIAGSQITKNVTLGSEIAGTVLIDGLAVGGVTVTLTNSIGTFTAKATTDTSETNLGRYSFRDLRADSSTFYILTFERRGLTGKVEPVSPTVGADVTRNVTMFAEIVGRVTTSAGAPAAGVVVTATGVTSTATTDADGNYRIPNLSVGAYTLRFEGTKFITQTFATRIVAGAGGFTKNIVMASAS